jgi:predicted nucleic acid-binding protein
VCRDYLGRLAESGTEIVFNRLLELELLETAFQLALKERHPRDWRRFRQDGRARPRAARIMAGAEASWTEVLDYFVWTRVELEEVTAFVPHLMADYGLASYDSVHAATALQSGARAILTIDAGFAALPEHESDLYVDHSRVASCRRRR